jgi:hypothetical protein
VERPPRVRSIPLGVVCFLDPLALMVLVEQKRITPHEAYMKASNKAKFEALVKDD